MPTSEGIVLGIVVLFVIVLGACFLVCLIQSLHKKRKEKNMCYPFRSGALDDPNAYTPLSKNYEDNFIGKKRE